MVLGSSRRGLARRSGLREPKYLTYDRFEITKDFSTLQQTGLHLTSTGCSKVVIRGTDS